MSYCLNIAFLMDPLETLDLNGDTTYALALEAQKRRHNVSFFKPDDLLLRCNEVLANICKLELSSSNITNEFKYHNTLRIPKGVVAALIDYILHSICNLSKFL